MPLDIISPQGFLNFIGRIVWDTRYIWPPLVAIKFFWWTWLKYIRAGFIKDLEWILLEVKIPREMRKSPRAMELILNGLYSTSGASNFMKKYWLGTVIQWISLEVASIGGEIHFFIRVQKKHKNITEAQIYGQYPEAEIVEVDDYANFSLTDEFLDGWQTWGTEPVLTNPDPYPIRTYIDYGLDKAGVKEEEKIDPMTSFVEYMGSIQPGHQVWVQILLRAVKNESGNWQDEGKKEVEKILSMNDEKDAEMRARRMSGATSGQKEIVTAIEKNISKLGFHTAIRLIYLAEKDKFNPSNIAGLVGTLNQYNYVGLNGFKPNNTTEVDYPPFKDRRLNKMKMGMLSGYRDRGFFYDHYTDWKTFFANKPFVLSTEEVATIYHYPGGVSETPTYGRVESRKGEAPANLPF